MRPWIVAAVLLVGCGARTAPADPGAAPRPVVAATSPADARVFAVTQRFGDLVAIARESVDDSGRASGGPCLVSPVRGDSFELAVDLALSIRPLPEPAASLEAPLAASPREAGLLSLFGFEGRGPVIVAAFTPMPPPSRAGAIVVVLAEGGAHVRGTGTIAPAAARAPLDSLAGVVRPMLEAGASPIVVAAEADLPLLELRHALEALGELGAPVALGVPLAPGIEPPRRLAPPRDPAGTDALRCSDDVTGAPPDASALSAAVAPLGARVRACRHGTASGDAARGGLVRLRIHARGDGHVREACASSEEIADATLLRCIESGAMGLALPPSSGEYAAELPIRLARDPGFDRAPLCPPR